MKTLISLTTLLCIISSGPVLALEGVDAFVYEAIQKELFEEDQTELLDHWEGELQCNASCSEQRFDDIELLFSKVNCQIDEDTARLFETGRGQTCIAASQDGALKIAERLSADLRPALIQAATRDRLTSIQHTVKTMRIQSPKIIRLLDTNVDEVLNNLEEISQ